MSEEHKEQEPLEQEDTVETGEQEAPSAEEKKVKKKKDKGVTFTREQAAQIDQQLKQLETLKDQFARLAAEYDNYRKRTTKEKDALYQNAKADTVKAFLGAYDNLERAVHMEGDDESPHKKGVEMIFHQVQEILKNLGVTEIEAQGQTFDPETMEAVNHIEDESLGENTVSQVFQAGFRLGDRVIRHAIVQVAN